MAATGSASGKPWANQNDAPPEPLDPEKLEKVYEVIRENGGAVPMGLISQKVPGVKKAHLQEHFEMTLFEQGKWEVRLPGCTAGPALYMHAGKTVSQSDGIPPLSEEDIKRIAEILQEHGGTTSIDDLLLSFPELKKQQLRELFEVRRRAIPGARGNPEAKRREIYEVSLRPGQEYPGGIVGPPNPGLEEGPAAGKGKKGPGSRKGGKGGGSGGKGAAMASWWAAMCQQLWDSWEEWGDADSWDESSWVPAKRPRQGNGPIVPPSQAQRRSWEDSQPVLPHSHGGPRAGVWGSSKW
mmetsp:Transcript_82387/g.241837  ORF Transcript_82387/g.241837 Transcript_82387/m.241837 type:complete len:296 (+) Transcript_82387:60-947(+)